MPVATTSFVASVVPVVATILGLLFACFVIVFGAALLTRVAGGPQRRVAFLVCAALVVLAAIRLFDGPWPGGRSLRSNVIAWQVDGRNDGANPYNAAVKPVNPERQANGSRGTVADLREDIDEAVAMAQSALETATESVPAFSVRNGPPAPVPPTAPAALDAAGRSLPLETSAAASETELSSKHVAHEVRSASRHLTREPRSTARRLRSEVRRSARGFRGWVRGYSGEGLGGMLVMAFALAAFLFVGYVFLDAGTRGQFTWSLRLVSLLAFVLFFAALARWSIF